MKMQLKYSMFLMNETFYEIVLSEQINANLS